MASKYLDEINRAVIFRGAARLLPRLRKEKLLTTRLIPTGSFIWISRKRIDSTISQYCDTCTLQSQRSFNSRITSHSLNLDLLFTRVFIHKSTTESTSIQTNVLIVYFEIKLSYNKRPHGNEKYIISTNSLQTLSKKAVDTSNRKLQTGSHRPASACALSAVSWFSSPRHFARLPSGTFIGVCTNSQRVTKYMNRVFSREITSWRTKTMKRRPCWCPKPILWELNSFLMQTISFVPMNLHRCWPR